MKKNKQEILPSPRRYLAARQKGEIPASVARKILDDNPRRFYGL
jgi:hypothetical protein